MVAQASSSFVMAWELHARSSEQVAKGRLLLNPKQNKTKQKKPQKTPKPQKNKNKQTKNPPKQINKKKKKNKSLSCSSWTVSAVINCWVGLKLVHLVIL